MDLGGCTYAKLKNKSESTWVAFPTKTARVGDTLSLSGCVPMPNFQSKALNRTFELIFLCNPPGGVPATSPGASSHASSALPATHTHKIKVEKAAGPNAYTVERLYARSSELNGKEVVVRAKVVKVSTKIMKRNWIHLQDGSGSAKKKTDELVVTSEDLPAVGEVITATGILVKDKDFGSGYKFSVIIEKGHVQKVEPKLPAPH
jgi:hypothetical protein